MNSLILTLIFWTSSKRNKNHLGMRNSSEQELPCLKRILSIHCHHYFTWTLKFSAFIRLLINQSCCSQKTFLNVVFLTFEKHCPTRIPNHFPLESTLGEPWMLATYKDHLQPPLTPQGPLLVATDARGWLLTGSGFTCRTHNLSTAGARMVLLLQKSY